MTSPYLLAIAQALREGRIDAAEQACRDGLDARPGDAALLQAHVLVAFAAERFEEVLTRTRTALAATPDHAPTMVLAGRSARKLGDLGTAARLLARAVEAAPTRAEPAFLLCAVYLEAADPQAMAMLDRLTERFPADAAGWAELGRILAKAEKAEAALACFRRSLEAGPSVTAALRCAALLKDFGRLEDAREALDRAEALGTLPAGAWFLRGLVLQDLGDLVGSADAYRRALGLDPALAEAAVNLGIVLQQAGDLDGAKDAYGQALKQRPDTFGRIAQAMTTPATGELWLNLEALRHALLR